MLIALGYTKSLSLGRGAELVEAERGFANLSLFAFYRFHTSLYLNTSSIQLNSYAYKLLSPLSRPSGRQLSPRRASLVSNINSSCLHTENLSYTHPNTISKSNSDLPIRRGRCKS